MQRQSAAPGSEGKLLARAAPDTVERVALESLRDRATWEQYLHDPDPNRIGIACSGGGVRSASYNLGALQVLRKRGVLDRAAYVSAVSGGAYAAIAHVVLVSETLKDTNPAPGLPPGTGRPAREEAFFRELPPFAPGSPEEEHLRNHTSYLAHGSTGKVWFVVNMLYGMARHLLPVAAWLFLLAAVTGAAFYRWVGPELRKPELQDPGMFDFGSLWYGAWAAIALAALAIVCLGARQFFQSAERPSPLVIGTLQAWTMLLLVAACAVALLLFGFPALLVWLRSDPFDDFQARVAALAGVEVGGVALMSIASYLARRAKLRRLLPLIATLASILLIGGTYVGLTYWVTQQGLDVTEIPSPRGWPAIAAFAAGGLSVLFAVFLDEVTPNMHWFYRERLASAFVGMRMATELPPGFEFGEPPWQDPVWFSKVGPGEKEARLPKLVVCAAVNLSEGVPPGRMAASFTFEQDFCGGPLTGYIAMDRMEGRARAAMVTLPALIAVSGAALSPSMGKMTRPWLRLLMALFNVRLGVWLPNPLKDPDYYLTARGVRAVRETMTVLPEAPTLSPGLLATARRRFRRPGVLFILREALGLNSLSSRAVYVTDGGHWDNLGLVELLRRGCCQILCFDAAGDDLEHFHTLSEAIALARADLGVSIEVDLSPLRPKKGTGESESDHVVAKFTYPNGTPGVVVFAKAAMTPDSPQDAKDYRERDPKFPTHPTSDQLFNERKFESYRALGAHAAKGAVDALNRVRVTKRMRAFP